MKSEIYLVHNLYGGFKENKPRVFIDKSPTIRTAAGGGHIPSVMLPGKYKEDMYLQYAKENCRKLTTTECHRLQTYPDGWCDGVSNTQQYRALGNSFTVDVIAHIFKPLKLEQMKQELASLSKDELIEMLLQRAA